VRDRGSGHYQFFVGLGEARSQGSRQCGKQQNLFHECPYRHSGASLTTVLVWGASEVLSRRESDNT